MVNGERNIINLFIENNTKQKYTLLSIGGSFHDPETDRLLKNVRHRLFLHYDSLTWTALADDDDEVRGQDTRGQ